MSFSRYEQFLKDAIGLDAPSIGHKAIAQAVQQRAAAVCGGDLDAYWRTLCDSATERQSFIERIVVPETWFFRDRAAFEAVVTSMRERSLTPAANNPVRLLSIPCSTGEEAYSLAMTLLDAGIQAPRFAIDAVDVSALALSTARAGIYRRNSFRATDLSFRDRYFEQTADGYRVRDVVRESITFRQGNLLAGESALPGCYDLVFCRNLLIYFDRATQERAAAVLSRLVAEKGLLFVGPSETSLFTGSVFVPIARRGAFGFEKRAAGTSEPRAASKPAPMPRRTHSTRSPSPFVPAFARPILPEALPAADAEDLLAIAERLANAGQLDAARERCAEAMRRRPADENAFFLMGVLEDARGQVSAAIGHFRRALYLQPGMLPAMIHLAVLLERTGDAAGAERLRARADRAERHMDEDVSRDGS